MKTMTITKELREGIREQARGNEPVDKTVRRILRNVHKDMGTDFDFSRSQRTNIAVSEDTYKKLEKYKLHEKEPINRVLKRAVVLNNIKK